MAGQAHRDTLHHSVMLYYSLMLYYRLMLYYSLMLQGWPGLQAHFMSQYDVMMLTRLAALLCSLSLSLQLHQVCIKQQAPAEHAHLNLDAVWPCWAG